MEKCPKRIVSKREKFIYIHHLFLSMGRQLTLDDFNELNWKQELLDIARKLEERGGLDPYKPPSPTLEDMFFDNYVVFGGL